MNECLQAKKKQKVKSVLRDLVKQQGGSMKLKDLVAAVTSLLAQEAESSGESVKDLVERKIAASERLEIDHKTVRLK